MTGPPACATVRRPEPSPAQPPPSPGIAPLISVVICTHNRAVLLQQTLASLVGQRLREAEFEILVVDNRSTDDTSEVVRSFASAGTMPIRYLFEPALGLCQARNTGWQAARGRYVAYLDDDTIAAANWLTAIKAAFESNPEAGAVGGRVDPLWEVECPSWLSDHAARVLAIVDWGPEPKPLADVRIEWLVGANLALPRTVLAEIGGFHPALDRVGSNMLSSGDVFLQKRILDRGYRCIYYPPMAVQHTVPRSRLTKRWFRRRYYWQGISDAVMQLLEESPSPPRRLYLAARRAAALAAAPRSLRDLLLPTNDPVRYTRKCFAWIAVGHVAGLLGAARR